MESLYRSIKLMGIEITFHPLKSITTFELSQCMIVILGVDDGTISMQSAAEYIINFKLGDHFTMTRKGFFGRVENINLSGR